MTRCFGCSIMSKYLNNEIIEAMSTGMAFIDVAISSSLNDFFAFGGSYHTAA